MSLYCRIDPGGSDQGPEFVLPVIGDANLQLALHSLLAMIRALSAQIKTLERLDREPDQKLSRTPADAVQLS